MPASQRILSAYCCFMYLIKYVFYKIIKAFYRTFFPACVFSHHWTSPPTKTNIWEALTFCSFDLMLLLLFSVLVKFGLSKT